MDLVAIIRIAMRALARNKLRSILTMRRTEQVFAHGLADDGYIGGPGFGWTKLWVEQALRRTGFR